MDLIMNNDPGSNVYDESGFLEQLHNVRNYLTEKNQKASFYYYDRNAGVLRIYGRSDDPNNGIEIVTEESEIQAILAALHSDNLPAGKEFVGIFDRQSDDVIRFEPKFGEGTFSPAEGPWPALDDVEYEGAAGAALKNAFNDLDDASSFVYDPYDEAGEVAWDGELRTDGDFGFLKWSTFGFSQLSHLVKNGEIDTKIWNNDAANLAAYNEQPLHIWTSVAGVGDQLGKEYKDLKETVVLVGQVLHKPKETLEPIYQGIKNLTFDQLQKMATQSIQGLQGNTAEAQHKRAEAGTGAVMLIFKMTRGGGFIKILDEMNEKLNKFLIVVRKFDNQEIADKLRLFPEGKAQKFSNDFENISDVDVLKFRDNPKMVDAWEGLSKTDIRTDVSWLTRAGKWIDEGAEFAADGSGKLSKNGEQILAVKNNKILPDKYDYPSTTGTPIGEASNGYQVIKNGGNISVRRVPDEAPYANTVYKTKLTEHSNAHVLERHGHDVTDDALIKRANEGIAPDGSTTFSGNPPPYSSKFGSPDKIKEVLDNVGPGSANWNPPSSGNSYAFNYPLTGAASSSFGIGVPRGGNNSLPMHRVKVVYKKEGGVWKLLTMYPQP